MATVSKTVTSSVAGQGNKTITPDTRQSDLPPKDPKNQTGLVSAATQGPTGNGPVNDNCANAINIASCPFTDTRSTAGATTEAGEPSPCGSIGATVWYTYANPSANPVIVTATTCSSAPFDTALAAYKVTGAACAFAGFVNVACNDDACGDGFQSSIQFTADPNSTYKIQAGGFAAGTGNLILNVDCLALTCPNVVIHGTLGSNDPNFPGPRTSGNQIGRLNRNGIASSCASPKSCLIFDPANARAFDAYTFTNNSGAIACVMVNLNVLTQSGANYQSNAYLGSYDPNNICTNYLADPGLSSGTPPTPTNFSFNVPVGANFVIVVHTTNPGETGGNYDLTVVGNICAMVACTITCPANITKSNDPNQCGAVVTYPAPTTTGTCGTVTCSPASGSFFPVGTTTVTCTATAGPSCSFTVRVNDTQPPTITCPPNVTAVTDQSACVTGACATVNFPPPVVTDNCPGVTVACVPPSGSCLFAGVTTVTCTATDASGNTATCSFTITTFDVALQDDSDPSIILLWNSFNGSYRFCCNGITFTGVGTSTIKGCVFTLQHNPADRRVLGRVDKAVHAGTAAIQFPPGTTRCTITDRNTLNDTLLPACQ
jgi:hypothetical protein